MPDVASLSMGRFAWLGAVFMLLAVFVPSAATSGVSGVFWVFTLGVLLVWLASLAARAKPPLPVLELPSRGYDDGYY